MRRGGIALAAAVLTATALPAESHRLDEVLQASLLTVQVRRVTVAMRIVPGQAMAASVIAAIDRDGDGRFSTAERRDHAASVLRDLLVTVDGRPAHVRLVDWRLPPPAGLRDGLGEITLRFEVEVPDSPGDHSLTLRNRHRPEGSVYMVDALQPTSDAIRIVAQKRDAAQASYELDYRIADTSPASTLRKGVTP